MDQKMSRLSEIGRELPFCVPEDYFDQFALQWEGELALSISSRRRVMKRWLYVAAFFVGIVVMGPVFFQLYQNRLAQQHENYEAYLMQQVDEGVLLDYYVEDDFK